MTNPSNSNGNALLTEEEVLKTIDTLIKTPLSSSLEQEKARNEFNALSMKRISFKESIDTVEKMLEVNERLFDKYKRCVDSVLPTIESNRAKSVAFFKYSFERSLLTHKPGRTGDGYIVDRNAFNNLLHAIDAFRQIRPERVSQECKTYFEELSILIRAVKELLKPRFTNIFRDKEKRECMLLDITKKISNVISKIDTYNFARISEKADPDATVICVAAKSTNPTSINPDGSFMTSFSYYTILTVKEGEEIYPKTQLEKIRRALVNNQSVIAFLKTYNGENELRLKKAKSRLDNASEAVLTEAKEKHIITDIVNALVSLQKIRELELLSEEDVYSLLKDFQEIDSDIIMQYIYDSYLKAIGKNKETLVVVKKPR